MQVILQQWWATIKCVHTSGLIAIKANVAICQKMSYSKLLDGNGVFLQNLAPLGCGADSKQITYHPIFFSI
jgi:hypothetical protein